MMNANPIEILTNTLFDIKEKITDSEYMTCMDALASIHKSDTSTGLSADKHIPLQMRVGNEIIEDNLQILEKDTIYDCQRKVYDIIENVIDSVAVEYEIDLLDFDLGEQIILHIQPVDPADRFAFLSDDEDDEE